MIVQIRYQVTGTVQPNSAPLNTSGNVVPEVPIDGEIILNPEPNNTTEPDEYHIGWQFFVQTK